MGPERLAGMAGREVQPDAIRELADPPADFEELQAQRVELVAAAGVPASHRRSVYSSQYAAACSSKRKAFAQKRWSLRRSACSAFLRSFTQFSGSPRATYQS